MPTHDPIDRAQPATTATRVRDPRLDVFRGLAMLIIFISHTPGNPWSSWIPGRWGFSDATEVFVFCSGMASAIAFGGIFDRRGWWLGTVRIAHRVWQVYWAHIGLFLAIACFLAALDESGAFSTVYIGTLNLWAFFGDRTGELIVGLMTLTYVPNYFDILPMYLAILAMIPVAVALARVSAGLAIAASLVLWTLAQGNLLGPLTGWEGLHFPAEPWSDREWFFNPFAWQLVFFTGFALVRGWIPQPSVSRVPVLVAGLAVAGSILLSPVGIRTFGLDWVWEWRRSVPVLIDKTDLGLFRYVHFVALAYVAWVAVGPGGRLLKATRPALWSGLVAVITTVGQQSLGIFMISMFWSRVTGVGLDIAGRSPTTVAIANVGGCALLVAAAYGLGWIKGQPWKARLER